MIKAFCIHPSSNFKQINIESKTYGFKCCYISVLDSHKLQDWQGICVQSTNTRRAGKNPSLYPCVWKYENGKTIVKQVHKVLGIPCPKGYVIDHINGDTFDNRRSNLEVVTRAENTRRSQQRRRCTK